MQIIHAGIMVGRDKEGNQDFPRPGILHVLWVFYRLAREPSCKFPGGLSIL